MWRPNQHQWVVIWATVILAFLFWLDAIGGGDTIDDLFGPFPGFGESTAMARAFAVFTIVAGGLLLWMLGERKSKL